MKNEKVLEKIANQELIDGFLAPKGSELNKAAAEDAEEYLRMRLYEDGFYRKILPGRTIDASELTEQVDTDVPVMVVEKEPNAEYAYSLPFGTMPIGAYIKGPKFRVMFDRVMSRRHRIDIDRLITYKMPIRQVFEDILLKRIQEEEDRKFLLTVNGIVTQWKSSVTDFDAIYNPLYQNNLLDPTYYGLGFVQNITYDGMTRENLVDMTKGLPTSEASLNPSMALVNNITVRDVIKFGRDEIGGDLSEEMFKNGFSEQKIMGLDWAVTIKKRLVRTHTIYQFAEPKFMGKSYFLRDVTLSSKAEDIWIEFFAWETLGGAVGNAASVCVAHFNGDANHSWEDGTSEEGS